MSKLSKEYVGKFFEVSNKFGTIKIKYRIIDLSFDHDHGTRVQYDYEILSVKYYIPEINEYQEIDSVVSRDLEILIKAIVENDL